MMVDRPSVRDLLAEAARLEPLPPEAETRARAALETLARTRLPWYLRLVIGVGAWVGALFLLSFVISLVVLAAGATEIAPIVIGALLTAGAIALRRSVAHPFLTQVALVCAFAGQALVIGGTGNALHSGTAASVAALFVSGALLAAFPDRVQRFSSTLVIIGALTVLVFEWKVPGVLDALVLAIVFAVLGLWRLAPPAAMEEAADIVEPIVYGLVIALFGLLIIDSTLGVMDLRDPTLAWLRIGPSAKTGLVLGLLWLASSIFMEHGLPLTRPEAMLAFAGIGLLGVLTRPTPAIVTAILVGLLGFDRRAKALVTLATTFFVVFGAVFYYNLQITLLRKSILLAVSGIVCLAAWALVRWRFTALSGHDERGHA